MKKPSSFLVESALVPSEKVVQATGKVVFNKRLSTGKDQVYQVLPETFSFTDIASFENCPMEYKFKQYLRLPMPGSPQLSFGQTIHKTLEKFANEYKAARNNKQQELFGSFSGVIPDTSLSDQRSVIAKSPEPESRTKDMPVSGSRVVARDDTEDQHKKNLPPFKRLEELYEQLWIDEWYYSKKEKEDYRQLGKVMLKMVYDDFEQRSPAVKYIEHAFSLPIGAYKFVGKIDRIDDTTEGLEIIDYKTNGAPKIKGKRDVDQLRVYQWAVQDYFKQTVVRMYYWHLKDNKKREMDVGTPAELAELHNSILESIEDIRHTVKFDLFAEKHAQGKQHSCNFADYL